MSAIAADERPLILAVEPDSEALERITAELQRYERDYRVVCVPSTSAALPQLEVLRDAGGRVAVVLAARGEDALTGEELLRRVTHLHPHAKRALLIPWGGWADDETAEEEKKAKEEEEKKNKQLPGEKEKEDAAAFYFGGGAACAAAAREFLGWPDTNGR